MNSEIQYKDAILTLLDGIKLKSRIWFPKGKGPWPALLMRQPYGTEIASTVTGTLSILGFNPKKNKISRGVVESIGCNSGIIPGNIAFRGNWGTTYPNGFIIDKRMASYFRFSKRI